MTLPFPLVTHLYYLSQVFFVVRLNQEKAFAKTTDPDPLVTCDLMEGRDAFLTMAREKHWEFSSLRRAKFSTLSMLVQLHHSGSDRFIYHCNHCEKPIESRYTCSECEVRSKRTPFSLQLCVYICTYTSEVMGESWGDVHMYAHC